MVITTALRIRHRQDGTELEGGISVSGRNKMLQCQHLDTSYSSIPHTHHTSQYIIYK